MSCDRPDLHPSIKDVVFAHIPKTAGTSLRNILVSALPDAVNIFDYGPNTAAQAGNFVNAYAEGAQKPEGLIALRSRFERDQRLLVSGHFPVRRYLPAFHPASFITFLRDPADRLVSAYKHHTRYLGFTGSFAEFCAQRGQINTQSRLLRGVELREIGFIGLTELMPEMLPALSRHLNVPVMNRRDNVGSRFGGPKLDDRTRADIMALNDKDVELYQHVKANLDYYTNYRSRNDLGPPAATGRVRHNGNGTFRGWARAQSPGRLVEIEVKLGTQVVHRSYADQFVPRLLNRIANGVGGFTVQLPPALLAQQRQVRFVVAGTDQDLSGSPITLDGGGWIG